MVAASTFFTGKISGHLVKYSVNTTMYRLPDQVIGNGPSTSTARREKAASTGIGRSGA